MESTLSHDTFRVICADLFYQGSLSLSLVVAAFTPSAILTSLVNSRDTNPRRTSARGLDIPPFLPQSCCRFRAVLPNVSPGVTFACVRTGMPARLQGLLGTCLDLNQSRAKCPSQAGGKGKRDVESERTPSDSHLCVRARISPPMDRREGEWTRRYMIVTIFLPLALPRADQFR